jgi:hypothetical protein
VAIPFTVESFSPHPTLSVDENGEFIENSQDLDETYINKRDFTQMILENLKTSGVQQAHKEDKINFKSRKQPGSLGHLVQQHFPPFPQIQKRPHCRENH